MKKQGRNIEIIVPEEGTLTFTSGILSVVPIDFGSQEKISSALVKNGFRTVSGQCDESLYPSAAEYARADKLDDYTYFNQAVRKSTAAIRRKQSAMFWIWPSDGMESIMYAIFLIIIIMLWMGILKRKVLQADLKMTVVMAGIFMEDLTNCGTPEVQRIVFDVIREAVTNAARHGLATKVEIAVARPAGGFAMTITDNGMNLADDFREGGGITGMREKAQKIGARLTVTPEPRFTIEFAVPGDGVGVSDRAGTGASKAESDSKTGSTDADGAGAAAAKGGEAE